MYKPAARYLSVCIFIITLLILAWFLFANIYLLDQSTLLSVVLVVVIVSSILLAIRRYTTSYTPPLLHLRVLQRIVLIITFFSVLVRVLIHSIYTLIPSSDPAQFFNNAQAIAKGVGIEGNAYIAFFPYVAGYDNLLAVAMKVIPDPWLATIVLNTVIDIGAAFLAYLLVKRLTNNQSRIPYIAFILWVINPFNILFSVLPLPVIVVNFFITLSLLLIHTLFSTIYSKNIKPVALVAIVTALSMGIGSWFRPIFIIFIIALVIYFAMLLLQKGRILLLRNVVISLAIILPVFYIVQYSNVLLVSHQTGIVTPVNSSGWSIYVGSNLESGGRWNSEDSAYRDELYTLSSDLQATHDQLKNEGFDRYMSYNPNELLLLLLRKMANLAGAQNQFYDMNLSVQGYKNSIPGAIFNTYSVVFLLTIISVCIWYVYQKILSLCRSNPLTQHQLFSVYVALAFVGIFFSHLLVEVSLRYAQVFYPLLIILATLALYSTEKRTTNSFER